MINKKHTITTISIDVKTKKILSLQKIKNDFKSWDEYFSCLHEVYEKCGGKQ